MVLWSIQGIVGLFAIPPFPTSILRDSKVGGYSKSPLKSMISEGFFFVYHGKIDLLNP